MALIEFTTFTTIKRLVVLMSNNILVLIIAALFTKAFIQLLDLKILDVFLDISAILIIATLHTNGVL